MSNLTVAVLAPTGYANDLGKERHDERHHILQPEKR